MSQQSPLPLPAEGESKIDVFRKQDVRKTLHEGEWWFSVKDVLEVLTDTPDGTEYVEHLRKNDKDLDSTYQEITCTLFFNDEANRAEELVFISIEGLFRLMQSVPTAKAEPFKKWLAKVGFERLQEIHNPELAIKRAMALYRAQGYSDEWIDARIRNKASRELLTSEWDKRNMSKYIGLLTDAISVGTFGIKTSKHKAIKGLSSQNLRDNMTPIELTLTTLGEQVTREITKSTNAISLTQHKDAAKQGGRIAGAAKTDIEKATGNKVVSQINYLTPKQRENNSKEIPEFNRAIQELIKAEILNLPSKKTTEKPFSNPLKIILNDSFEHDTHGKFKKILQENQGDDKVYLKITTDNESKIIETGFKVKNCPSLKKKLNDSLGDLITIVK